MLNSQHFAFQYHLHLLLLLYPFNFPVSFDQAVEDVAHNWCNVQCQLLCWLRTNVVLVIQFFQLEPSTVFFPTGFHSDGLWFGKIKRDSKRQKQMAQAGGGKD